MLANVTHITWLTMVYSRYIELVTMVFKPTNITGGAPPCIYIMLIIYIYIHRVVI